MLTKNAKLSLALKKENFYMSAYDGCFVFGLVSNAKYIYYMLFHSYELSLIYINLRKCLEFLIDTSNDLTINMIKKQFQYSYSWKGKTEKMVSGQIINSIEFVITSDDQIDCFLGDIEFIQSILTAIDHLYLSCLELSNTEKYTLHILSHKDELILNEISTVKSFASFFKENIQSIFPKALEFEIFQLFLYYKKEIIILSNINLLDNE